jgi:hypothetical protein
VPGAASHLKGVCRNLDAPILGSLLPNRNAFGTSARKIIIPKLAVNVSTVEPLAA